MRKLERFGWTLGASLLLIGGGVTTSLATTSCSDTLGLKFDLTASKLPLAVVADNIDLYLLQGTVSGLKDNWSCILCTTTDGKTPTPSDNPTNVWEPTESYEDLTKGLMFTYTMNTGVGFMGAEDTEVGGKITMKDVYAAKVATDGSHSKWYKLSFTLQVYEFSTL